MIYSYKCPVHGLFDATTRANSHPCLLDESCSALATRRFSFSLGTPFAEHYNPSTGKRVRTRSGFASELSRQSDEASERTGIEHNYVPVDPRESPSSLGVTEEGLYETARRRHDSRQ
jgi:hypothetical protein